uniref:Chitin synthase export chaperone n=1 Tax=Schistosoma mansoni TaxID=6183 RepID=A0A3Q0KLY1_SCHMA
MLHNCVIGKVINLWTQGVRYNLDRLQEASNNQRQYSNNKDIFTLNVLGITVLQFAITFGGTYLFILVQQISGCIKHPETILWVSSVIYLVLQLIWMFVPGLSRKYPYNIMYLILMTLFSTLAIASDATLYFEAIVNVMFGVSVTLFNLVICTISVLQFDFTKYYTINLFVSLFIDMVLLIGQSLYFILSKSNTVLCIAGAIALPFTVLKLLYEVKMVFGGGKFRYEQADLVLAAGVLYNCWWNLFLTLMWISSYSGLKNADTRNTTLPNVKSSVYGMILTK